LKNASVVIPDFGKLKDKMESIRKEGSDNLHFISDFDRTLTYGSTPEGEKIPSLISMLRIKNCLDKEYSEEAKRLYAFYHSCEVSPELSEEEKKVIMKEWWNAHLQLFMEKGLKKDHLEEIVKDEKVRFREGADRFFENISQKKVPIIIFSASGCGEVVELFFKRRGMHYSNTHFLINRFHWNEQGRVAGVRHPIIHSFNKNEVSVKRFKGVYEAVRERKNVVLFGDSLSDAGMAEGFDYRNLLKVGFLNLEYNKAEKERYEEIYDVIMVGDVDFNTLNENILRFIL